MTLSLAEMACPFQQPGEGCSRKPQRPHECSVARLPLTPGLQIWQTVTLENFLLEDPELESLFQSS
jgi:hypothetical protein